VSTTPDERPNETKPLLDDDKPASLDPTSGTTSDESPDHIPASDQGDEDDGS
jgi:hypothetical protein